MTRVLVVDDSPTQALLARFLLESAGLEVASAEDGEGALEQVGRCPPDLVLTDLHMPGMSGLELVEALRCRYPLVPVILMTAFGSEEVAIEALQKGAASYVPKKNLDRDLAETVGRVLALAEAARGQQRLFECITHEEYRFVLDNDTSLVTPLVSHLSESVARQKLCDGNGLLRMTVAWSEALTNAIQHGNLEVSSELRQDDERAFHDLIEKRRGLAPYRERRVHVTARLSPEEATVVVRDEGPGFDPSGLPDPNDPANLGRIGGRGLLLIRTFMDQVFHNNRANEITLVKRARPRSGGEGG